GGTGAMDLPIACTLGPQALKTRREGLLADVVRRANEVIQMPNGVRMRFPPEPETPSPVARAVDAERLGCRFLGFDIVVVPAEGEIGLELRGPPGTAEFIAALAR